MCATYIILNFLVATFEKIKGTDEVNFNNILLNSVYPK